MGKTKQAKEKKFDRNVEISRPILDAETIKAIHTPPKGQRLDIKHGGFKALLSDPNSQDSIDELTPLNDNHVPSYIGISCAVSGYSNYSSYSKKTAPQDLSHTSSGLAASSTPNRSRTNSPLAHRTDHHQIHHITIDKNNIHSADEERRELTEKLTASATDRRRSPSPCIPPTEDDRHHGAYVGARYCPLPPPSKIVNKHIPLLGIDDEKDPDSVVEEDINKVEKKIASLYGGDFVEDWRESMTHKSKKEHPEDQKQTADKQAFKTPKDLVTLKPTPQAEPKIQSHVEVDIPTPDVKVLAGVEKQFLNKLLSDDNPPKPLSPTHSASTVKPKQVEIKQEIASTPKSPSPSPVVSPVKVKQIVAEQLKQEVEQVEQILKSSPIQSPTPTSPVSLKNQSEEELRIEPPQDIITHEEHIDYEIRAQSPLNNDSSPVRQQDLLDDSEPEPSEATEPLKPLKSLEISEPLDLIQSLKLESAQLTTPDAAKLPEVVESHQLAAQPASPIQNLVSFSPEPQEVVDSNLEQNFEQKVEIVGKVPETNETADAINILVKGSKDSIQDAEVSLKDTADKFETLAEDHVKDVVEDVAESVEETKNFIGEVEATLDGSSINTDDIKPQIEDVVSEVKDIETKLSSAASAVEGSTPEGDESNDGRYYLEVLNKEKSFILEQIERAQVILDEREAELDEDTLGRIRSAIGKANLLINKKCNQFKELCEANISMKAGEQYATLNDDLAGFWDMLSIQVSDVRKSFESLWQDEKNDWSNNN